MLARSNENSRRHQLHKSVRLGFVVLAFLLLLAGFNQQFPGVIASLRNKVTVANTISLTSRLMDALDKQGISRQFLILEGMPYLGGSNNDLVHSSRTRILTLSFYILTRVDITDPRTFFAVQLPVPGVDPLKQAAYNPADPEQEGPLIEVVEEPPPTPAPGPPGPALVAIYTTHNAESYQGNGGPDHVPGGKGEIKQVAAALAEGLEKDGLPVVHSETIHDEPKSLLAYSSSFKTATQLLASNPKLQTVLDIHRDGMPPGTSKRIVNVQGKPASPVMIVLGTKHPNWQKNEAFAKELIAKGNAKYPNLFLPIYYATDARYNQHLHPHALLLEFGDQYNTVEEAENAGKAVADVLAEMLKPKN
jgi:stage II sporulation protein P